MLRKITAQIKKDFLIETSYKFAFLFNIFSVLASILTYFFIDKLFGHKVTEHLEEFGVSYFSYVLLSMAFFSYIGVGLGSFSSRIRGEQLQGTLESLLLTPTKISILLAGMALWNLIIATFDILIYLVLGIFIFKINFSNINILSTTIILILTMASFSCLGIISASFILIFKRGNPVGWIINTIEGLLGGVYFPVTVMPGFLQTAARFFPITYAIRAIELAVYRGYSLPELKSELIFLCLFCLVLTPLSGYTFKYALKKARRQGSLLQY
ncbi:MAG: ABC transporter permease [Candidatus Omnitrophica bacterium]|nr:ABC transporter permease [Candidatus Omnitrophota bacterium]MBU4479637.1 ABC transporter permease [Candidatus Omnitrophota bacterium]MCG2703534.1 ABC transporter permease [Candidatus Omnitrophota bacterium]